MGLFKRKKIDAPRRRSAVVRETKVTDSSSAIFKRNRTLTGTTSSRFSSSETKLDLESPRVKAHHLVSQRRKGLSILLIIFFSTIVLGLVIFNFTASISISLSDSAISKDVDSSLYEASIGEYLDINPMSRLHFLLDQSALASYMSSNGLPEVMAVEQRGSTVPGKTNFVVTMRNPVAGWQIDDKQYYVDSRGIPFERNYFSSPDVQIVDNSGASMQTSTAVASKRFLSFIGRVVSLSKSSGYIVTRAALPVGTTRELEISLKEVDYLVKLSIDRSAGEQVEDMARAIQYFTDNGKSLSYVDVRVSSKAFYK